MSTRAEPPAPTPSATTCADWTTCTVAGVSFALHLPCRTAFLVPQDHDCATGEVAVSAMRRCKQCGNVFHDTPDIVFCSGQCSDQFRANEAPVPPASAPAATPEPEPIRDELSHLTDRLMNWLSLAEPESYASRAEAFAWAARAHELARQRTAPSTSTEDT